MYIILTTKTNEFLAVLKFMYSGVLYVFKLVFYFFRKTVFQQKSFHFTFHFPYVAASDVVCACAIVALHTVCLFVCLFVQAHSHPSRREGGVRLQPADT